MFATIIKKTFIIRNIYYVVIWILSLNTRKRLLSSWYFNPSPPFKLKLFSNLLAHKKVKYGMENNKNIPANGSIAQNTFNNENISFPFLH